MKKTVLSILAITFAVAVLAAQVNAPGQSGTYLDKLYSTLEQMGGYGKERSFYSNSNLPLQQNDSANYQPR